MSLINSVLKAFVGDKKKKDLKGLQPIVDQVRTFESQIENSSLDALRDKTAEFKKRIEEGARPFNEKIEALKAQIDTADIDTKEDIYKEIDSLEEDIYKTTEDILNEIMPEAFAVMKETAKRFYHNTTLKVKATPFDRELSAVKDYVTLEGEEYAIWNNSWDATGKPITWDMIHYDVQLIGGAVLHQGKIAEMMTGEGKTLVATLPIYLNALTGKGVHVVTVNDYLAKRDAAWMGPLFEFHGLRIDCIDHHQPNSDARRRAYNADITYGTNNEFGFDYLRDNMAHSPKDLVQRPHNYAIVDEVDSVLVDDARTPLIISGAVPEGDRHEFNELKPKVDNIVNTQRNLLTGVLAEAKKLIAEGNSKDGGFHLLRVYRGLPKNKALIKFLSQEGVKQLLQKTENYYMQDNNREMPKVDEGLYFVIDEKNNSIELTDKGIAYLSGDKEADFFVLPDIGTEIAKIEKEEATPQQKTSKKEELYRDYSIKSERIHTLNQLLKAYTLFEKDVEYVIIEGKVKIVDEQTGRVMEGRRYSDGLHQAIEAKENVKVE
ncbi:MAG: preprotein translocase subunit SecA, partial [Flavobacteriaceae bacterium]|nr:preprotein translocase subunit SecA [Flavobacteriaceae bacterium]